MRGKELADRGAFCRTRIKLCGLTRTSDIETANERMPEYVGFVFAKKSRRYVTPEQAMELRQALCPAIQSVGVFVDEDPETVAELLHRGMIDLAQLHGNESEEYIKCLRNLTNQPIIKAFRIETEQDVKAAEQSSADYILLDSGSGGTGTAFDWELIRNLHRPYFLAGGLDTENVREAVEMYAPYAVDVSSGIETDGVKDKEKIKAFVRAVRGAAGKGEYHDK